MKKEVKFNTEYEVSSKDILLTIVIGNGQPGSSRVKLNGKLIAGRDINGLVIGKGNEIKGSTLKITTVVNDFQINTNRTSVQYLLSGGTESKRYYLEANVDIDGDSVYYFTNIKFI